MQIKLKFIVDIILQSRYRDKTDQGSKNHINIKIDPKCMDIRKFNTNTIQVNWDFTISQRLSLSSAGY